MAAKRGENGKKPGNSRDCKNWHGLCDAVCIGKGRCPQPKGKKKMDSETTNLFRRRDTFFGICEAVGQDFGFNRSEEHTSELQSLMRISYAVFCLKKKNHKITLHHNNTYYAYIIPHTSRTPTTNNNT